GELAVVLSGDIWWGLVFALLAALLAAFLGELFADLFLVHGDSHIDPPAAALFTTWTLQSILAAAGVFKLSGAVAPILAIFVAVAGFGLISALPRTRKVPLPAAQPAPS